MAEPIPAEMEAMDIQSVRRLWQEAVGRVFKLKSRPYGVRTVTYTQVRELRDTGPRGEFEIVVLVAEITARVLNSKRTHSNICKEGVLPPDASYELTPGSFGEECERTEFDKVTGAILAYTNSYLDWVMQDSPDERTELAVDLDLPHLRLTAMEATLVRNSPFLLHDVYFISPNSIRAAQESIRLELQRASRNMRLTDAVDPVYVQQKNDAVKSLGAKLQQAADKLAALPPPAAARPASSPTQPAPGRASALAHLVAARRPSVLGALEADGVHLALLGRSTTVTLMWVVANPTEEGPVFCLGTECSPLEFVRWAHVSGRRPGDDVAARKDLKDFFHGLNHTYTGPDADGVYPLLKPALE